MPYLARDYTDQKELVGNGQCVTLVKKFSNAPVASSWSEGETLVESLKAGHIVAGTVIATFVKGRYPNDGHGNQSSNDYVIAFFCRNNAAHNGIGACQAVGVSLDSPRLLGD